MISFIAAHWWTWPLLYAGVGALFAGFSGVDDAEDLLAWVILWPIVLCVLAGSCLRNVW